MSNPHHSDTDDDGADVRTALATLVAYEPDLPSGSADIERRGRRRLTTQRLGGAAAVVVLAAAGVSALSLAGGPTEPDQVAQPSEVTAPVDTTDPAGSTIVQGFPVGSAVDAVGAALPAGASLAELPMDIGWREGGLLDVPVTLGPATGTPGAPTHVITIQVVDGDCSATVNPADALSNVELTAIAQSVCAEWVATGSLPVIPAGPSGEESPELANQ
jgi:hypothetical protein